MNPSLEPYINRKIVILHEEDTAFQAARAMCENQIGCVVLSDHESNITGVVTDRDLVCCMVALNLSPETELRDLVTRTPITVTEDTSLDEILILMERYGVRRVPILRDDRPYHQKVVGMVTLDDLIAENAIDSEEASWIVQTQMRTSRRLPISEHQTRLQQTHWD